MPTFHCAWGTCKSDSRNKKYIEDSGIFFVPFPNPRINKNNESYERQKCLKWIKACGRPERQLSLKKITRYTVVCSLHFVGGKGPTTEHPDPLPAIRNRSCQEVRPLAEISANSVSVEMLEEIRDCENDAQHETSTDSSVQSATLANSSCQKCEDLTQENNSLRQKLVLVNLTHAKLLKDYQSLQELHLAASQESSQLSGEAERLKKQENELHNYIRGLKLHAKANADEAELMKKRIELVSGNNQTARESMLLYAVVQNTQQITIQQLEQEVLQLKDENSKLGARLREESVRIETLTSRLTGLEKDLEESKVGWSTKKLGCTSSPATWRNLTGFDMSTFFSIYYFFIPNEETQLPYNESRSVTERMPKLEQFLLVMSKLRTGLENEVLAFSFGVTNREVSCLFTSWINFMAMKLAVTPIWPPRQVILQSAPEDFRKDFPSTLVLLDATELKIERPSSLVRQSQYYSEYKSATTVKCLVACDPRGALLYVSPAFSGSISDQELVRKSGFLEHLKQLMKLGFIQEGDAVMADKGFLLEDDLASVGVQLNVPPLARKNTQMPDKDVDATKQIARHRIHVERLIGRIRIFRIIDRTIRISNMTSINQIWMVCAMLTRFMPLIVKNQNSSSETSVYDEGLFDDISDYIDFD